MYNLSSPASQVLIAVFGAGLMLIIALLAPQLLLLSLPVMVVILGALAVYQFPQAMVAVLVLTYGLGLDIQLDVGMLSSAGATATFGAAVVKVVPFALTAVLVLRYGPATAINWPFLAFTAIAAISIVVLPIGRIISNAEMLRSYVGSTAPFVLAFAMAPRRIWTMLIQGTALVPIISAVVGLIVWVPGLDPAFDLLGRFQGMHTGPFLAGFCITALFACTLEYLRGFKLVWLVIGGLNMAVLLATQARAPFATVMLFLGLVFLLSDRKIFPLKRKVDLVMGGMVPGLLLLGPMLVFAMDRFLGDGEFNYSGRDVIWPYFTDAIQARPLFGFGLGAGKLIVDPDDPTIKLLGSSAAHNEYLRLAVDAGIIGCAAIFISIIVWIWGGSRNAAPADRLVLRCALAAALLHSTFDNTLIATISVMQFSLFAAMLARARAEAKLVSTGHTAHGRGTHRHRAPGTMAWRQSKVE
jgi:O-antigen ligase